MASPYSTGRRGVSYNGNASVGGLFARAGATKSADDFFRLSKALKAAGQKELRNELNRAMRDAAKPLIPDIREDARRDLPKKGGLNERIARKPYRAQTRTGAKTAGVRIVGTKVDPRINQGRVAHPVFGRKGKAENGGKNVVVQQVPGAVGYFTETIAHKAPQVRGSIEAALGQFAERIVREVKR